MPGCAGRPGSRCGVSTPPMARAMPPSWPHFPPALSTSSWLSACCIRRRRSTASPPWRQQVIAVNYQGAVSILARLEPLLAAAGQGAVVVLSSVAGDRGRPSNFVYGSAKAGLNVYLQGLRARLSHRGVSVTTIKAGFMDTAMTYGLPGMFLVASPEDAARACLDAAEKKRNLVVFSALLVVDHGDHQGDSRSDLQASQALTAKPKIRMAVIIM